MTRNYLFARGINIIALAHFYIVRVCVFAWTVLRISHLCLYFNSFLQKSVVIITTYAILYL